MEDISFATAGSKETFTVEKVEPSTNSNAYLDFFPTAEGYFDYQKNLYVYQYKDHLGNARLTYANLNGSADVVDQNDYYPFGLNHPRTNERAVYSTGTYFNYKYNGKELQETGMYDYGARFYMPDIGRWGVQDLISEADTDFSPYNYVLNNPVLSYDLFGFADCPNGDCPPGITDTRILPNGERESDIEKVVITGKKANSTLDTVQTVIEIAGYVPVLQTVAGVANAGIDINRGNYGSAALNLFTAIPGIGYLGKAGKLFNLGVKVTNNVEKN